MGSETIILTAALLLWMAGYLLLGRLRVPFRGSTQDHPQGSFSIVIPARNEERNLPALLRSIAEQSVRPLEVIVVDDASTDRTAEIARQFGAILLTSQPLSDGWRGKTWACQQGANAARGEMLLFVDADTWFEKDGLAQILAWYDGGAVSICPYHAVRKPYEQLSAFFNLIMVAATVPRGLFGQMLLVDRESYRRVGGHEAVKGRILENFFLAERFAEAGIPLRGAVGKGVFAFRMYPDGIGSLIEGWTKGFASGAARTPLPLLLLIVAWVTGMIFPLGSLHLWPWAELLYLLFALQIGFMLRQVGAFSWYTAILYPFPLAFYLFVFGWSLLRSGRTVNWKGRAIRAD
jgi:4,4'-diaponeurosporenoate glycosyltransferase